MSDDTALALGWRGETVAQSLARIADALELANRLRAAELARELCRNGAGGALPFHVARAELDAAIAEALGWAAGEKNATEADKS